MCHPSVFKLSLRYTKASTGCSKKRDELICTKRTQLLVILSLLSTTGSGLGSSLHSTGSATTVWGGWGKVNVLLGVKSHHEGWNGDNLLTNGNVSLGNENSGVVNGSGKTELENLGLESSLKEVLDLQGKNVIELHLVLGKDTDSHESSDKSVTLEESLWVLLVSGQKVSGSSSKLGELETNSVDLVLVLETVLTSELKLSVESGDLEGSLWDRVGLRVVSWGS